MSADLEAALWIAGIGSSILFAALIGLIALMYALTTPWMVLEGVFARRASATPSPSAVTAAEDEAGRRIRAAVAAVAFARSQSPPSHTGMIESPINWRVVHRSRRLRQTAHGRTTRGGP